MDVVENGHRRPRLNIKLAYVAYVTKTQRSDFLVTTVAVRNTYVTYVAYTSSFDIDGCQ